MNQREERELRSIFDVGLVLKAIASAFEIAGGIAVLFVPRTLIVRIADFVTSGELTHDPADFVANALRDAAHTFAIHSHYLLAGYLLARGIVKLSLVVLILRRVWLAYPLFIIALGIFGSYEAYQAVHTANLLLAGFAVFDTGLIFLTAYEYKRRVA